MKILMDTNFLLIPFKERIDIYDEINFQFPDSELFTLKSCVKELEKLKQKAAIDLLKQKKVKVLNSEKGDVDKNIVYYAENENMVVATVDRRLREELKVKGVAYIYLRQRKFLKIYKGKPLKNL